MGDGRTDNYESRRSTIDFFNSSWRWYLSVGPPGIEWRQNMVNSTFTELKAL